MSKTLKRTLNVGLAAVMLLSVGASAASANNNVSASRVRTSRTKRAPKDPLERAMTTMPKHNQKNAKYIRALVRLNRQYFYKYSGDYAPFTFGEMRHGKFHQFKKYVDMGAGTAVWMSYPRAARRANLIYNETFGHKKTSKKPVKKPARKRHGLMLLARTMKPTKKPVRKLNKKTQRNNHMDLEEGLTTYVRSGRNMKAINKLVRANRYEVRTEGRGLEPFYFGYEKNGSFHYYKGHFDFKGDKGSTWYTYRQSKRAIHALSIENSHLN